MPRRQRRLKSLHAVKVKRETLLELPITREAFDKLTRRGVDRDKLLSLLAAIPVSPREEPPLVEGMADRSVRALPDRIRSWAEIIERVNASDRLSPDRIPERTKRDPRFRPKPLDLTMTPEVAALTASQFHRLPKLLRFYGRHLGAWLEFFHPTGGRRRELGFSRLNLQTLNTLLLLKLVRDSCKRPHYGEIATLLEAAYRVSGQPKSVSPESLKKLEKNNFYLKSLLYPELFS